MAQKYKLIYCAKISDDKHQDLLKVGDTEFIPSRQLNTYAPNDPVLIQAAENRIRDWNGTAAAGAELVYCDALIRFNDKTQNYETYRDSEVHRVLQQAGFPKYEFDSTNDSGTEWFKVELDTVKAAIKATKEYRTYLNTSELPAKAIYDLRDEQMQAVDMTKVRFAKKNDMLWHAKMRFGKTVTALNLVKDMGFKRTIIITHRPVVEDSWGSDFYHVFSSEDKYAFVTKISDAEHVLSDDETNEAIDKANDERLEGMVANDENFVYFASIQDLRGSKLVGGDFEKNNVVFDINWDLVIIDEAHEGTKTPLGQKVIERLIKSETKRLDLSGTAYNLFDQYSEKGSVYTWDYVMEQEAKLNWSQKHPGEKNPYEDMPVMHINTFDLERAIKESGLDLSGKSFSFREFFRTWTGDLSKDGLPLPENREVGDFVHPEAVRRFLDLLSASEERSKFPYVTKDGVAQNAHSLWMIPGVKEAAALSKMLRAHPLFGQEKVFGIANIAGEGDHDEEKHYNNALSYVRKTIETHPCSITLSCGRLTTGVTVKEWSSVFMLTGSTSTDAKAYMQTIFRVQSAGKINGVQKKDAYVYDFAPDRTLLVLAASIVGERHGSSGIVVDEPKRFEDFLTFCPVIAIDGADFKPFSVESLVSQINRVQIDRALKTGFMDNSIYDMSKFKALKKEDIDKMNSIFGKLNETKSKKPLSSAGMARNGTEQGRNGGKTAGANTKNKPEKEKDTNKERKALEKQILEKLSTISIRLPLLFYGGNFEIEEGQLGQIITRIDKASWDVFMPQNLTKKDFLNLVKYYNQHTVIGAGKIIRSKAKQADELPPTERVIAIADIFSHFHNPSKETVLTPWRVVNLHMSDTLGGWCFYNEEFEENTRDYYKRLPEPRCVNHGTPTASTLANPDVKILEINSKSGLYPLYSVYSIYRAKLGSRQERDFTPDALRQIWDEAVGQVYVLCQSLMAADITKRTLVGYRSVTTHVNYDDELLQKLMTSADNAAREICKGSYWKEKVRTLKFDAVVGNPPYQLSDGGGNGASARPIYQLFVQQAKLLQPRYLSMITPSRWFAGGKGLDEFRDEMLHDDRLRVIHDYPEASDCFTGVQIKGGVSYSLWDRENRGLCKVYSHKGNEVFGPIERPLLEEGHDTFIRYNEAVDILHKVGKKKEPSMEQIVSTRSPFGFPNTFKGNKTRTNNSDLQIYVSGNDREVRGTIAYVPRSMVNRGVEMIPWHKVYIAKAGSGSDSFPHPILPKPFYGAPNTVCNESYLIIGPFRSEKECKNVMSYIATKFFRFLVLQKKNSQNAAKGVYQLVPQQDFSKPWSDEELYEKYGLSKEEIAFIDSIIKPMDLNGDGDSN